jgi:hypothetical protein
VTESHPIDFICSECGARYKVVRVKADAHLPDRLIHCTACKKPLAANDGDNILKYFLISRPKAKRRV